jgi:chromosome segregation ATPase
MSEAKWMKNHSKIMELEEKKNKLLADIETLMIEKRELVSTIKDLRKEVTVHGGDYDEITKERIKVTDELDEKHITLQIENEEKSIERSELFKTISNLQTSIKEFEEKEKKQKETKETLSDEIIKLNSILDELKLDKQNEEKEKSKLLKKITEDLNKAKDELRQVKKETDKNKDNIMKEERLLSIKRSDLEIYEKRMRKKYPKESFVLKNAIITEN